MIPMLEYPHIPTHPTCIVCFAALSLPTPSHTMLLEGIYGFSFSLLQQPAARSSLLRLGSIDPLGFLILRRLELCHHFGFC